MKKHLYIMPFLALLQVGFSAFSQEREKPVVEMGGEALGQVDDAFQEHFFEALKQKAIENYEKAINSLVQCLALQPDEPVVYLELGKNYNALKKYTQAAVYLEKARKAEPQNEAILETLYTAYFKNKDFEKALPVVKELVAVNDHYAEDLVNLYLENERFDEALNLLEKLDNQKGYSGYRESLRRQVYARSNNTEAQINDLREKIAEKPENEQDYLNLIFVYSENGQEEEAYKTAEKLLEVHPQSHLVHLALYKFYITDDKPEQAVASMKILLNSDQIDEVTKYQALNDFLIYVTENPELENDLVDLANTFSEKENNHKVYQQLGTFFLEKDNKELAAYYFNMALEHQQNDFGLYQQLIKLQVENENYEEVKNLATAAIDIYPTQAWLFLMAGRASNKLNDFLKAKTYLETALDYLIDDNALEKDIFQELSITFEGLESPEKAAEFLKKAKNN